MEQLTLDGGVDLTHSVPATPAGKLRECLNYEVGWERGYARIAGFERFDGNTSPSTTTGWVIGTVPIGDVTYDTFPSTPTNLRWEKDGETGDAGTLVEAGLVIDDDDPTNTGWTFYVFFRTGRKRPEVGSTITDAASGLTFVLVEDIPLALYEDTFETQDTYLTGLANTATTLRGNVRPVPGGGTIVGVHWHEDRLYAVRDVQTITVAPEDFLSLPTGMYVYNDAGQVGQVVEKDSDTSRIEIAPVTEDGFVLDDGDNINVALQFRFKDGTAPEFTLGESVTLPLGTFTVGFVSTRGSDWASGGGKGDLVLISGTDGEAAEDDVVTGADGGTCAVDAPYYAQRTALLTVAQAFSESRVATLWRSSDDGWVSADASRVLRFTSGETDPFSTTPVNVISDMTLTGITYDNPADDSWWWTTGGGTPSTPADLLAAMETKLDGEFANGTVYGQLYPGGPLLGMNPLRTTSFSLNGVNLPATAEVKGVSIGLHVRADDASCTVSVRDLRSGSPTYRAEAPLAYDTLWFGASDGLGTPSEDWNQTWTPADINAGDLKFKLDAIYPFGGGASTLLRIDAVEAKVSYDVLPGSTLYLWDGTADIGTVQLTEAVRESGAWADSDAAGFFILEDWDIISVPAGTKLYTAAGGPGGGGLLVGETASDVVPVFLPGSVALNEEKAKYQFVSYNFYATEDRNALYGCSGAGPAFAYEPRTNNLRFINTGVEDADTPRHVGVHQGRLALGYKWGEVYVSAPGDPYNFNGVDFAASYGFGDKVTGIMATVGDATAVFTESATWMLTGNAGDDSNPPRQSVVNARIGALEYTVQSMGNRPIYASFRGIETLETNDQFGEFFTTPMTYDISPWLLERLQSAAGVEATDKSAVNSVVVRNKNQYRLFFADGYVMTLTLVGPERSPQNTIQFYNFNGDPHQYARCFATASGVTSDGQDRAFFTAEARPQVPGTGAALPTEPLNYVYELDRGRSFDGGEIEAFFTLSYNLGQQQQAGFTTKRYNCIQLHGKVPGYASLRLSRAIMYEDLDNPALNYELMTMGSLSAPPERENKAKYTKGRLSGRGFAVSLRINHTSDREFPHVLQHITFVDDKPLREDR